MGDRRYVVQVEGIELALLLLGYGVGCLDSGAPGKGLFMMVIALLLVILLKVRASYLYSKRNIQVGEQ